MGCNCNIIRATSIAIETPETGEAYIQITVPATVTFTEGCYRIGLFTNIPTTLSCAPVQITNGTDEYPVLRCNGNNWRPSQLRCRSVLNLEFLTDPEHFLVSRR